MVSIEAPERPRALVADDEANARLLAQTCLEQLGLEVTCVADGAAAVAAAAETLPDLILLDVVMPELDGFAVCERLRAEPATAQTPIVLMTALDDLDAVDRAYRLGATDFITKPVNWILLQHRVRFLLRASKAFLDLASSSRSLEHAQRLASLASWAWRADEDRFSGSDELWRILACEPGALSSAREYLAWVHPADRAQVLAARRAGMDKGEPYAIDYRLVRSGDEVRHLHERGEPARDRRGRQIGLVGTLHDETERRTYRDQIDYMSRFDAATGLPNRATLVHEFRALEHRSDPDPRGGALVHLKLLGLDRIATLLGHTAADEVVQRVAGRLQRHLDGQPVLASAVLTRIDQRRLALLVPRLPEDRDASAVAREVLTAAGGAYELDGRELIVDAQAGVVRFPEDGTDIARLLSRAQAAARTAAPGKVAAFDHEVESQDRGRLTVESELSHAIERGEMTMHYQPIVRAADGRIHSVEALVRWNSPTLGPVSPARFIPVAEEMGMIDAITAWTLEQACRDAAAWAEQHPESPIVAVNLSATQLAARGRLIDDVRATLERTALPPERLELELTETVLVEGLGDAAPVLQGLRQLGLTLALDDFGTGFSSLSYLARFPMTTLKVDQTFLSEIPGSGHAESIVRAMVAMAHQLGLVVVCEGIETDEQLAFVRDAGADFGQGYLMSRPVPADTILELLAAGRSLLPLQRRAS